MNSPRFDFKNFVLAGYVIAALFGGVQSFAQPIARAAKSNAKVSKKAEEKNSFSGSIEITRSSSLYDLKNGEKYDGLDNMISAAYSFSAGTVSTKLSYTQDLNDSSGEGSTLNDSNISYTHKIKPLSDDPQSMKIVLSPSVTALLPLSKKSREVDQLQTAIVAAVGLSFLAGEQTSLNGFSVSLGLSAVQSFHQYDTDKGGNILTRNSSSQSLALSYTLSDWAFSLAYSNNIRWPYSGDIRNSFELAEEISYTFLKSWSVAVGHSNSGASLKPNGQDSNVSLLDENSSIVYLKAGYSF